MISDYSRLIDAYNSRQSELQKKRWRVWISAALLAVAASAILSIFISASDVFLILTPVFGGISVILLTVSIILRNTISEKPLFEFMYEAVIDDYNFEKPVRISYSAYPKEHDFIEAGGLFPRHSTKRIRFSMDFTLEDFRRVQAYDAYLFTQSNKSRRVYFDGLYLVLSHEDEARFQLRTAGSPRLKGIKYNKVKTGAYIKEYTEEGAAGTIPAAYHELFESLQSRYTKSQIYISSVPSELHVGIYNYPLFRKMKRCSKEAIEKLDEFIDGVVGLSEQISQSMP